MISKRKYKIYKKWFKLGFEQQKQNGFNPNSYHDIYIQVIVLHILTNVPSKNNCRGMFIGLIWVILMGIT